MAGYFERRKSRAATWCLRLAVLALPFFIFTIYLHRTANITTPQMFWLVAFGILILLISLMLGMRAAADLWEKGYKGGRATVNGIVLSVLLLLPFGVQLVNALEHPKLNDVSTDVINPPIFLQNSKQETPDEPVYDEFTSAQIVTHYPDLVSRRYTAPPERVLEGVELILNRWGWAIVGNQNVPEVVQPDEEGEGDEELAGDVEEASNNEEPASDVDSDNLPDILLQVAAKTMIMKLPSSLMIRMADFGDNTLVDIRSNSDWGQHDFGNNADNIREFLAALDVELAGLAGER